MRYAFIFNPAARHGRARKQLALLEAAIRDTALDAVIWHTEGPQHAETLAQQAAPDFDAVIAAGGDGTVLEVSRGLIASKADIAFGVLPLGTGNDFVKMTGMPFGIEKAFPALLKAQPIAVDYGRVQWHGEGESGAATFLNAIGIGFDARAAVIAPSYKFLSGTAGYLLAVLHTLWTWEAPEVQLLDTDGTAYYKGPLLLVTAGNGRCSGGGFYLTPDASITDGQLDLCIVEAVTTRRALRMLPSVLSGSHVTAPEVHMRRTTRLIVETHAPLTAHTDGEILTQNATRFDIDVVAGGLRVLMPPSSP